MNKQEWHNRYPLNTFTGETKEELIELIYDLLIEYEGDIVEIVDKFLLRIPRSETPKDTDSPIDAWGKGVNTGMKSVLLDIKNKLQNNGNK